MHLGSWYFPSAKRSPVCSSAMLEGAAVPAHVTGLAVWALDKSSKFERSSVSHPLWVHLTILVSLPKLFNAATCFPSLTCALKLSESTSRVQLICQSIHQWSLTNCGDAEAKWRLHKFSRAHRDAWQPTSTVYSCDSARKTKRWPRDTKRIATRKHKTSSWARNGPEWLWTLHWTVHWSCGRW